MTKRASAPAFILIAALFAYGCEEKGPAEKAGEKIDEAFSEAQEQAGEAAEKMEEARVRIDEALEEAEEAGEAIKRD